MSKHIHLHPYTHTQTEISSLPPLPPLPPVPFLAVRHARRSRARPTQATMFSNRAAELSLAVPVAALEAVRADRVCSRFLAGTSSVRASEDDHLHVLRFHSEANRLGVDATLAHPTGAVARVCASPSDRSLVLTVAEGAAEATLWRLPPDVSDAAPEDDEGGDDGDGDPDYDEGGSGRPVGGGAVRAMGDEATLAPVAATPGGAGLVGVAWGGAAPDDGEQSSHGDVLTLSADGTLSQWDVGLGAAQPTRQDTSVCDAAGGACPWSLPPVMAQDPHHSDLTAVATGTRVRLVDWRVGGSSSSSSGCLQSSFPNHRYGITDLDYNPNKPNMLTTSGRDGLVKFWDLRKSTSIGGMVGGSDGSRNGGRLQKPVLVARGGHRHWATRVCYNPFHDQLVLSAGTDSIVNLWRMSTISSAPLLTFEDEADPSSGGGFGGGGEPGAVPEGPNVRVSRYEHMDSVHSIAWGAADAWIYVSGSYDGKVVLNHVPSKEKYKILL